MAAKGVNTFGERLQSRIDKINEDYQAYCEMKSDVQTIVRNMGRHWIHQKFLYFYATSYCQGLKNELIPAEYAAVVYSFRLGVIETYSGLIDPGFIPMTQGGNATLECKRNALPYPGCFQKVNADSETPEHLLKTLFEIATKHKLFVEGDEVCLFVTRGDLGFLKHMFNWLGNRPEFTFNIRVRMFHFEMLLMEMSLLKVRADDDKHTGIIHHEGGAAKFIFHSRYDFDITLGCEWHKRATNLGQIDRCARNVALRRVYNSLHYLCCLFNLDLVSPSHAPVGFVQRK